MPELITRCLGFVAIVGGSTLIAAVVFGTSYPSDTIFGALQRHIGATVDSLVNVNTILVAIGLGFALPLGIALCARLRG